MFYNPFYVRFSQTTTLDSTPILSIFQGKIRQNLVKYA